jgi:hypothetical protein
MRYDVAWYGSRARSSVGAGPSYLGRRTRVRTPDVPSERLRVCDACRTYERTGEGCDPYIYYQRVRTPMSGWRNNPDLPQVPPRVT